VIRLSLLTFVIIAEVAKLAVTRQYACDSTCLNIFSHFCVNTKRLCCNINFSFVVLQYTSKQCYSRYDSRMLLDRSLYRFVLKRFIQLVQSIM